MTNHKLLKPNVVIPPVNVDLDAVILQLQGQLGDLEWIEKIFGRAREIPETQPDKTIKRVPKVYLTGGEYYPVMPNDALRAYSFFRVNGRRTPNNYKSNSPVIYAKSPVDLIVWANLKKIDRTKDYIYTEELINAVVKKLNKNPRVEILGIWDDKPENIFAGYTLSVVQRDLLMYPFQAFRIEMNIDFPMNC